MFSPPALSARSPHATWPQGYPSMANHQGAADRDELGDSVQGPVEFINFLHEEGIMRFTGPYQVINRSCTLRDQP